MPRKQKDKEIEIIDMSEIPGDIMSYFNSDTEVINEVNTVEVTETADIVVIDKQDKEKEKPVSFTALENEVLIALAEGKSIKQISLELGIPQSAINRLTRDKKASEHLKEMISARNTAIKAYLPQLMMSIIEDKVDKIKNNPEATIGDITRKDVVDVAKVLNELLKGSDSTSQEEASGFNLIYQQIGVLNNN